MGFKANDRRKYTLHRWEDPIGRNTQAAVTLTGKTCEDPAASSQPSQFRLQGYEGDSPCLRRSEMSPSPLSKAIISSLHGPFFQPLSLCHQ